MYSGKDLAELSGYTSRVYSLLASLHALDNGIYPENSRPAALEDGEVRAISWELLTHVALLRHVQCRRHCYHRSKPPAAEGSADRGASGRRSWSRTWRRGAHPKSRSASGKGRAHADHRPKVRGPSVASDVAFAHELQWSRQELDRTNHRAALASMGGTTRKASAWRGRAVPSSSEAVLEHWLAQRSVSGDRSDPADVVRVI
jgi:hypothetical protein